MKIRKTTICLLLTLLLTAGVASGFNLLRMAANDVTPWVDAFDDDSHDGAKTLATHIPTGNPERGPSSIVSSTGTISPNYWSSDPVAGSDYSSDFSAGVDGWNTGNTTLTGNIDFGGKTDCLRVVVNSGDAVHLLSRATPTLTLNGFIRITLSYYVASAQTALTGISVWSGDAATPYKLTLNTLDAWTDVVIYVKAASTSAIRIYGNNGSSFNDPGGDDVFYLHGIGIDQLTQAELFTLQDTSKSDIAVKADLTIENNSMAGVVARYVDANNFLHAYIDETSGKAVLDKVISGTRTNLINTAVTYVAGATIQLVCDGNSIDLFYNNAKVGVTQTESTLSAATIHGGFSTDSDNVVENLVVLDLDNLGSLGPNLITGNSSTFTSGVGSWVSDRSGTISASGGLGILTPTTLTYSGMVLVGIAEPGNFYNLSFKHRLQSGVAQVLEVRNIFSGDASCFFTPTSTQTLFSLSGVLSYRADFTIVTGNVAPSGAVYEIDDLILQVYSPTPISNDADWTSGSGTFVTASARHTETLGATVVVNGDFTANTNNWTPIEGSIASVAGGLSGNALEITRTGSAEQYAAQTIVQTIGIFYKFDAALKAGTSGNETATFLVNGASDSYSKTASAAWVPYTFYYKAAAATVSGNLRLIKVSATAGTMLFDSVSVKPITLSSVLTLANLGFQEGRYWFTPAAAAGELSGIVLHANDSVASTHGLFCYVDRTAGKLQVFKRVAGTDTSLLSTAITYSAGAKGCLVYDATEGKIWAFYNNAIVGTAQAYTPASGAHTWSGGFSTGDATFDDFSFEPFSFGAEIASTANATSDPYENEADGAGGFVNANLDSITSVGVDGGKTPVAGSYQIKAVSSGAAKQGYIVVTTTSGNLYRSVTYGVLGTSASGSTLIKNDTPVTLTEKALTASYAASTLYWIAQSALTRIYINTDVGTAYWDSFSVKEVN